MLQVQLCLKSYSRKVFSRISLNVITKLATKSAAYFFYKLAAQQDISCLPDACIQRVYIS